MPDELNSLVTRLGGWRRVFVLVVGAASVALILAVSRWASAPTMVPVISGAPIETTGQVTDQLSQAGIPYRLDRGGLDVSVAATDLARARVALAKAGLPEAGRPGMELFDKPAYAMTDFTQRVNYRRALEGELERTLGRMRSVESAQVHLALHESSAFRSASVPAEASVVLKLHGGEEPAPDIVRGIAQLVASSVDGLESEHVTVLDDAGRLMSAASEPSSATGMSSRQLEVQRDMEQHLAQKAEEIVGQMVGHGNARVQVSALLNFDRMERTTQTVDPDRQVAAAQQKAEIVPGAQGGAGSSNTATTFENSRSTEVYAPAIGSIKRLTVAVLVNDAASAAAGAAATRRTPEELARIESLVRNAVGFDSTRGDQVSIVSVPFVVPAVPEPVPEAAPTVVQKVRDLQPIIINVGAVLLAFVIGFLALRAARGSASRTPGVLAAGTPSAPGSRLAAPGGNEGYATERMLPEIAAMQANSETRSRVLATVSAQPEVAAKLARAWMKEA